MQVKSYVYEPSLLTMCQDSNHNEEECLSSAAQWQEGPWLSQSDMGPWRTCLLLQTISNTAKRLYRCRPRIWNFVKYGMFSSSVECYVFSFLLLLHLTLSGI